MSQLLNTLFGRSKGGIEQRVSHYLYFKAQQAAVPVVAALREQGFDVEDRESADGKNWLVLAHHDTVVTPSVLESLRVRMKALAEPQGGEYDGWEAAVG
jgi:regulator of ribonuclease activity B